MRLAVISDIHGNGVDLGGGERLLCVHGTRESYDLETFRCAILENGMPHGGEAVRRLA